MRLFGDLSNICEGNKLSIVEYMNNDSYWNNSEALEDYLNFITIHSTLVVNKAIKKLNTVIEISKYIKIFDRENLKTVTVYYYWS